MAEPAEYESLGGYIEEDADLRAASEKTWDFWDNSIDDTAWNEERMKDRSLPRRKPMIIGRIGADLRPMVPIVVQGANGQEQKILFLLSTGFREALLLPAADVAALSLPQTGARTVTFPDGSQIEATAHPAKILLAGEAQDVDILAGGSEPRMGLRLLEGYRISMRFVEGGPVSVERL